MSFIHQNKSFFLRIKRFLNSTFKIEIFKYPTAELNRRIKLFNYYNIEVVLDVGANIGQYGSELRSIGYKGRIISFEPTSFAFKKLEKLAKKDKLWDVYNMSLGEFDGETTINISQNSVSSSILDNLPELTNASPKAQFVNKENIKINKLDTIFKELNIKDKNVFLKMDTQGYEKNIIEGANESLKNIKGLQLEMALIPTYLGALDFEEMKNYIQNKGYTLQTLESGFYNQTTGQLYEVDGVFFKN
jgi:FkbM family methyltransferase